MIDEVYRIEIWYHFLLVVHWASMPLVFQVLGLTATIGVGKSSTLEGAVSHILSVCASLDVLDISKVKQNKEELESHVEVPTRGNACLQSTFLVLTSFQCI